jgi:tripartite-type tricarboxylate transporter receptor subunit TctC
LKHVLRRAAYALLFATAGAVAQDYPSRPVTVIVPFSAGSASDVMARIVLERMSASVGQRFVVENRPAAGGNVGTAAVAKATPDGYTIVMTASGPLAANRTLFPNLGYDPEKDFEPISLYASLPNIVVVSAKLPIGTLAELTDYVRKNPKVPVGFGVRTRVAGSCSLFFHSGSPPSCRRTTCSVFSSSPNGARSLRRISARKWAARSR